MFFAKAVVLIIEAKAGLAPGACAHCRRCAGIGQFGGAILVRDPGQCSDRIDLDQVLVEGPLRLDDANTRMPLQIAQQVGIQGLPEEDRLHTD